MIVLVLLCNFNIYINSNMGSASSIQSIQDKKSIFNNTQNKSSISHNTFPKNNNMTSESIFFFINNQYDIGESLFLYI